jgi:hypothetical protein
MWERDYHLAQANQHIAEAKQRIARQRDFIAMLECANQPSEPALSMLEALEKSLTALEQHRQSLLDLNSRMRQGSQGQSTAAAAVDILAAE